MELLLPWLLSYILDFIVPKKDVTLVYFYGGLMVLCAILAMLFNIIANRMSISTSRNITRKLRHDLFEKIFNLSCSQTDEFTMPSLISRLTSDTYNVHRMVDRMQRLGVRAPILLIGGIITTLTLDVTLTSILLLTLPILAVIVFYISKKGVKLYTLTQKAIDNLVLKIQESMAGIRVIKALSKTEYEKSKYDDINKKVVETDKKASTLMSVTNPAMNLLLNLGLTAVVVVGAFRVNLGLTQPGKIIAFLSYFTIILNSLMMVTRLFMLYSKGAASANRIQEVLNAPKDLKILNLAPSKEKHLHIEFKDVYFSYNKVQNNLENINFTLKKGETLGIIGATGSGKSTIVNLLLRFYDVDSGAIYIFGENISNIPRERLYSKIGVVFQNDFIFADTIKNNINFGRDLTDKDIEFAAKAAQAGFINEKEKGFDYRLTVKGANLSGGQKQRLLIARALAAKPEILLLDDSSSALDYITDAALRKALYNEFKNTTKIIIAQRISSILSSDKILVIDDGKIEGYGTHQQLLNECDIYKEIYNVQMSEVTAGGVKSAIS